MASSAWSRASKGEAPELFAGLQPGPALRQRLAELSARSANEDPATQRASSLSRQVDNRGAIITQQINVFGNATFGATSRVEVGGAGQSSAHVVVDLLARVRREVIDFSAERGRHKHLLGHEDVFEEMDA